MSYAESRSTVTFGGPVDRSGNPFLSRVEREAYWRGAAAEQEEAQEVLRVAAANPEQFARDVAAVKQMIADDEAERLRNGDY